MPALAPPQHKEAWSGRHACSGSSTCRAPGPHRPAGSTSATRRASRRRARACDQASELSADDVLQHLPVQREIGDELAQLRILVIELLQPAHLGWQQPLVLLLPIEIPRLADPARRQISATVIPSAPRFGMNAFWASENFESFIVFRSSQPMETTRKRSSSKRSSFKGSDQGGLVLAFGLVFAVIPEGRDGRRPPRRHHRRWRHDLDQEPLKFRCMGRLLTLERGRGSRAHGPDFPVSSDAAVLTVERERGAVGVAGGDAGGYARG